MIDFANFDIVRLELEGLGAFVLVVIGLAAKEAWPIIKAHPMIWLALLGMLITAFMAFALMQSLPLDLPPKDQPALILQVQYALAATFEVAILLYISSMAFACAILLFVAKIHRELQRFQQNLMKSPTAATKRP